MMMMVTVRRRVVCDLLILALLCCCCCFPVCGTAVPAKTFVKVEFSCPGTDGKLSWRLVGEDEWKKCPKKPGEVDQDSDERARLCVAGGDFYEGWKMRRLFCLPPSDQVEFLFVMKFATYGGLRNSSSATAISYAREATDGAQRLQSQPQAGTAAPAATAAASTTAVVDQAQSGLVTPPREAAEAPQKKSPDQTAEGGSYPMLSENVTVKEKLPDQTAEDGSASRPSENFTVSPLTSAEGAANETSHNSNEGDSQSDASGEGNSTVAGTNPLRPTRDESANESTEDIAALLQNFVGPDGSDVTTVWVRTPLLLLVIALVCAAVR